jgi:hypothetical protein
MGAVWLADHLTLGVPCAVKIIADQGLANPSARARFHAEAYAVARVQSANVVRIFDHDVCEGVPYIAMEFLEGEDLRTRLQRLGRLGTQGMYRIVSQLARGLAKAHAAGVVHRDLKPENVFIADEDGVEVAKLLDFGIAKLAAYPMLDAKLQVGAIFGSPSYMSPEQAFNVREIDHRSDLWSLGVIGYECLTGRRPFEGETPTDLLAEVMAGKIPVPSDLDPELPGAFDDWWARAAARDPDQRFQNANELADALAAALGIEEPILCSELAQPVAISMVFDLVRRRVPTPGSPLAMAHNEVTHAESRPPRFRRSGLFALASIMTIAVVVGGLLDARADPVRRVATPGPPTIVKALTATRSVPEVIVEVPSTAPVRVTDRHVEKPAPRPAPNVARHPFSEYYCCDGACVGVRDRLTGDFVPDHPALGKRMTGGMRFLSKGIEEATSPESIFAGERLCFSSCDGHLEHDIITSALVAVERPPRDLARRYAKMRS